MKSKFFKDTQGLGECYTRCPPGKVCICLRMDKAIYGQLLREAGQLGITSGDYIQQLMEWHSMLPSGMMEPPDCRRPALSWAHQRRPGGWSEE